MIFQTACHSTKASSKDCQYSLFFGHSTPMQTGYTLYFIFPTFWLSFPFFLQPLIILVHLSYFSLKICHVHLHFNVLLILIAFLNLIYLCADKLTLSLPLTPVILLSMLYWHTCILFINFSVNAHVWQPYVKQGRMHKLKTFLLSLTYSIIPKWKYTGKRQGFYRKKNPLK